MIKTHFKDDEKKLRALLKMIIETIPKPDYKNMSLYEIYILDLEKKLENKDKTIDDYKKENKKLKRQLELKNNGG